jgi:F0F1-type ATP synthase membrane subunit b/b'
VNGVAEVLYIPEALRERLGEQATRELVGLINQAAKSLRENVGETAAERIERRLAETKTELEKQIVNAKADLEKQIVNVKADLEKQVANVKTDLIKWMFVFWVGQAGFVYLLVKATMR